MTILDAYAPLRLGTYRGRSVTVRRRPVGARRRLGVVRTPTFDLGRIGPDLVLEHGLGAGEISDDLTGLLSTELFEPGWLRGPDLFQDCFVGVVLTCAADPCDAWEAFYRNSLHRIDEEVRRVCAQPAATAAEVGSATPALNGSIEAFAPVNAEVVRLTVGTDVLELGSCFGFQALRLAAAGARVTASDVNVGSMHLLQDMSERLGIELTTRIFDARHVALPDRSVDTVLAIHLLEHLDDEDAQRVIAEACRVARRRVVVAVPFEDEPREEYGHLKQMTTEDLRSWGAAAGRPHTVHENHGGWLVIDC